MSTTNTAGQANNMDPFWKCDKCGHTLKAPTPPETCPSCKEKCLFKDVSCYTPDCGGPGRINPRIWRQSAQYCNQLSPGYQRSAVAGDTLNTSRLILQPVLRKGGGEGIRFDGKPLGRPMKHTAQNAAQIKLEKKMWKQDALERIPIEGKFGQGKNGYRLNYIRAKTAATSEAWIRAIFLVMNLMVLIKQKGCVV